MICPRCKCEISDDSKTCEICGKKIAKGKRFFGKSKKSKTKVNPMLEKEPKKISAESKIKLIAAVLATVAVVIVILVIIVKVNNETGINTAKEIAEYINEPILTARNETDIYLSDESAFDGVNNLAKFHYVVESEKHVEVDGVKYPKWAVLVHLNDNDEIANITYVDFTVLKKNHKGCKTDGEITLDEVKTGDKYRKTVDKIDAEPFAVVFDGTNTTYVYKYYFINEYKDEQAMTLSVVFNKNNDYAYSTSQRLSESWIF